jgi:thiol-disulfide isomerase/thioredoxin
VIRNFKFICENPDEPLSAYLVVALWQKELIFQYTDSLGIGALNSVFGHILRQNIESLRKDKRIDIAKKGMIGEPAPEFTLKDINGNDFSLSSLRGKYVVLDFWGSWCLWCLVDFPEIKNYYAKYPDEFEIVGIAFSEKVDAWRRAVLETYSLPWINVFDEDDLHDKYYVTGAPSYVLIDKEGLVVDFPMDRYGVIRQLNELREKRML